MKHPGISGDGDLVVLPTLRNAWLWSVKAGHPIGVIRAGLFFDEQIRPTFTHDGTRFVTADSSGELRVWRSDGGDLDPRVAGLGSQTVKLATGTNAVVLAGTSKGQVFLVDAGNGKAPRLLSFRPGQFARCAVSPTGLRGAAIFKDGLVTLFALPTGSILGTVQCEKTASKSVSYEDVEFVGEDYVVAFNGVTPSLIDFQAGQIVARDTNGWNSVGASEGPGARNLLATTESGALKVMEVPTLRVVRTLSVNTKATVWSSALSPSGLLAAAGLGDGHVLVFDLSSQAQPVSIAVAGGEISVDCVAIDSAGKRLAFGAYDGRAGVVDLRKPLQPRWFQAPDLEQATGAARNNYAHLGVVEDVRFSPDGGFLVTCSGLDGFTRVWQTDGRCIEALNTSGAATFARLLDDGRLVTMTEQGEVSLWRVGVRALLDHFRARSNATLLPPERIRYLNEEPGEANKRYREQERLRGRTPLPPEFTKIDYR
jgi:WD40 repeat protein